MRRDHHNAPATFPTYLVVIFVLLTVCISGAGYYFYAREKDRIKRAYSNELLAIADLKVDQITNWRKERLADATLIRNSQLVGRQVKTFFTSGPSGKVQEEIAGWMEALWGSYEYESVLLLDADGRIRLSVPQRSERYGDTLAALIRKAGEQWGPVISSLYRSKIDGALRITIATPLIDRSTRDSTIVGFVALRIDPHRYLFPLIHSWPTQAKTGETVLVCEEGDSVLYLNELRHMKNVPLELRISKERQSLPAVQAIAGHVGVITGRDYRDVQVFAAARRIPGTSWYVITKEDSAEVLAPIEKTAWAVLTIAIFLLAASSGALGFVWRNQQVHMYRRLYESELEKKALTDHFEKFTKHANDIILLVNDQLCIVESNDRAMESFGYSRDELVGMDVRTLRAPRELATFDGHKKAVEQHDGFVYETVLRRKDGTEFPVESSTRIITVEGKKFYQTIIRDITDRKQAELQIKKLNRLYAVLSETNQAIVRTNDQQKLFEEICRIAVEVGKFHLAWVGFAEGTMVRVVARHGHDDGYLDHIRISTDENDDFGRGPTGTAIREGRTVVAQEIETNSQMAPWRKEAAKRGYRSSIAIPLKFSGHIGGSIQFYSTDPIFFDEQEVRLLEELASDISYALESMQREKQRIAAETALKSSEQRYRRLFESSRDAILILDGTSGRVIDTNPAVTNLLGYSRDELLGVNLWEINPFKHIEKSWTTFSEIQTAGFVHHDDLKLQTKDGRDIYVEFVSNVYPVNGSTVIQCNLRDVTDRKRADEALRVSEEHFRLALQNSPVTVFNQDRELRYTWIHNPPPALRSRDIVGKTDQDLFLRQDANRLRNIKKRVMESGIIAHEETRVTIEGTPHYYDLTVEPQRDESNTIVGIGCTAVDITQRRRMEEALRESEDRFRRLAENAQDLIYRYRFVPVRGFEYVSPAATAITGYTPEEHYADPDLGVKVIHPDDRYLYDEIVAGQRIGEPVVLRWIRKDGSIVWTEQRNVLIIDSSRNLVAIEGIARDITERKRAEAELSRREFLLRESQRIGRIGSYVFDIRNGTWTSSEVLDQIFGIDSKAEKTLSSWSALVHPDEREEMLEYFHNHVVGAKNPFDKEYRIIRGIDGAERWLWGRGELTYDEHGPIQMVGTIQDITERKAAQESVRNAELKLRNIVENSTNLFYTHTPDHVLTYVSPQTRTFFDCEPVEALIRWTEFLTDNPINEEGVRLTQRAIDTGQTQPSYQLELRGIKGRTIWAEVHEAPIVENGKTVAIVGSLTDITDRKRAETALGESEERFRKLTETTSSVILIYQGDDMRYANPAAEKILGYTNEELLSMKFWEVIHAEDQELIRQLGMARQRGESVSDNIEVRVMTKRGEIRWVNFTATLIELAGKPAVLGTAFDITERKSWESKLRLQIAALESAANGVVITDSNGDIVWVNRAFTRMTGYQSAEILGKNPRILKSGKQPDSFYKGLWSTISSGKVWSGEVTNRRKDGTEYVDEMTITPVLDEKEQITHFIAIKQDVSERKAAEEKIELSDEILGKMGSLVLVSDEQGDIVYASPSFKSVLGYEPSELLGNGWWEMSRADLHEARLEKAYAKQSSGGFEPIRTDPYERLVRNKSGEKRWILWQDARGPRRTVIGVGQDITDRKQMEDNLKSSEARISAFLEATHDGVVVEHDNKMVFVNKAFARIYGFDNAEELIGKDVSMVQSEQDSPRMIEYSHMRERGEFAPTQYEFKGKRKDGSLIDLEASVSAFVIAGRSHIISIIRDISERKLAERQIREQAALLDISSDAIMVRDLNHRIRYWSKGAEALYGWKGGEVIGKSLFEIIYRSRPANWNEIEKRLFEEGEWKGVLKHTTKGGREILVDSRLTLMRDEQNRPTATLAVNTDITEKKKLEEQFLRAQRMESIGTLAGGIAHDLNNILAPILIAAEMLKAKMGDQQEARLAEGIITSAKRGAEIVKQVLTFSRGTKGEHITVDPCNVLKDMKRIVSETFPKDIEFHTVMPDTPWSIKGDPTQLHQVLMNLCVNARDAMPKGGTLTLRAQNMTIDEHFARMGPEFKPGRYLRIDVADTGAGIPSDHLERIFDPFFTTKEIGKGTGLGLATVHKIVKDHDGIIKVRSEVGKGTIFSVYLPAVQTGTEATGVKAEGEISRAHGETILVVDDEGALQEIIKSILESNGYTVLTAGNGIDALAVFADRRNEIKAVLTDMAMPVMDGEATIRVLKSMEKQLPILAMSGHTTKEKVEAIMESGAHGCIEKPFTADSLLRSLHSALRKDKVL
jgi:PAS domain S-box-containing protein